MNILVVGGSGFLGRHLIEELLKKGHRVSYLSRHPGDGALFASDKLSYIKGDLLKEDEIVLEDDWFDLLINCVGVGKPSELNKLNIVALKACISLCQSYSIPKMVFISANAGYPAYLKSKRKAEDLIQTSGLRYLIVRPGLLYGGNRKASRIQANCLQLLDPLPFIHHFTSMIYPLKVSDVAITISDTITRFPEQKLLTLEDLRGKTSA